MRHWPNPSVPVPERSRTHQDLPGLRHCTPSGVLVSSYMLAIITGNDWQSCCFMKKLMRQKQQGLRMLSHGCAAQLCGQTLCFTGIAFRSWTSQP